MSLPRPLSGRSVMAVQGIALNTFREAVRDRILYLLLVFALLVIAVSRSLSHLTVGSEEKIVTDLGLSAISIFGILTAVFLGVSLVFKEIDKRTIFTLLANPVPRWQFVLGKYLGLMAVLTVNVALMSLVLRLVRGGSAGLALWPAVTLTVVELALITAFALLFSSFTNPVLAVVGTLAIYVTGHLAWSFELLKSRVPTSFVATLSDVAYWALPNLSLLNVRAEVVHGRPVSPATVAWAALYGLAYAGVVLAAACVVFQRRDFK